jgi:general secretion pathway protein A
MYENFYGLKEKPFQITPNPKYLYLSSVHEKAITYLEYGLAENVGLILFTGEIGAGKTTMIRYIIDQFKTEKKIGVIFNTNVNVDELLCLILQSFKLEPETGNKTKNLSIFQQFLIDSQIKNKQVLLIVDEAQRLSDEVLEQIRMLSNLQSDKHNLIQIMLVGQPELKDRLKQQDHISFAQRIAVNFFLSGLTDKETRAYIAYRLERAGGRYDLFNHEAVDLIYKASRGIPRSINLLCDAALVYGFAYDFETIKASVVEEVIKDKGGMGINDENESKTGSFALYDGNVEIEKDRNNLKKSENTTTVLEMKVDYLVDKMVNLEEKIKGFQNKIDNSLKSLLIEERKRCDHLLLLYSKLKLKYDHLVNREAERDKN